MVCLCFTHFISCGAQMYQVSLEGDHGNPEASGQAAANSTDPKSKEFGLHAPKGWSELPIQYAFTKDMSDTQKTAVQRAMATWEKATGKSLFKYLGIERTRTGSDFPDLYTSLSDTLNGNYLRNDWALTKKSNNVLATTGWNNFNNDYEVISTADIHYNTDKYFLADALTMAPVDKREIVDMQSLALHELGHLLGLAHVSVEYDPSSIMNPSLFIGQGLATRHLSSGDVKRIHTIYGCDGNACDAEAIAAEIVNDNQTAQAH
jgi:hypothetical protein